MSTRSVLALTCALLASALCAGGSTRFSQSLSVEQRATTGLTQLNSDQLAALDALVRLDQAQRTADSKKAESAATPASFSQSLSVDQRRAAGLELLTTEQQAAVDLLVAAQAAPAPRHELAATRPVEAVEFFPNRFEVHGEVGFSFGGGSGGYSSRAAWLTTSLLDVKTGTEFAVTVASGREKWKRPYRWTNDWEHVGLSLETPLFRAP